MAEWLEIKPDEEQEDGMTVLLQMPQLQENDEDEPFRVARNRNKKNKSTSMARAKQALQATAPLFKTVRESLNNLNNPKEIEMQFNIGLGWSSENSVAAFVVGQASSEAAFSVRVLWDNSQTNDAQENDAQENAQVKHARQSF